MPAPHLSDTASLEAVRTDLIYLRARLRQHPQGKVYNKPIDALLRRWDDVNREQLAHWDAQVEAQAALVAADDTLDRRIDAFDDDLLTLVGGNRKDPRYTLYFSITPSRLKAPILGEELDTLTGWQKLLKGEASAELRAHLKPLQTELEAARVAVAARDDAEQSNARFRATGECATFNRDVRQARDKVFLALENERIASNGALSADYARSFFRPRPAPVLTAEEQAARKAERDAERQARADHAAKQADAQRRLAEAKAEVAALAKKPKAKSKKG